MLNLAQKGDAKEALHSCRAIVNAGRSLDDEPFLVSQRIRNTCISLACDTAARTLALGQPPPDEMARLQHLLEEEEKHSTLLVGLRGQRAELHLIFTGLANGSFDLAEALAGSGVTLGWQMKYLGERVKETAYYEHPRMLELTGRAIENARLPSHEQAAAEAALDAEIMQLSEESLMRLLLPVDFT